MEKLSFSTNWNGKLSNDCFTTLRLSGRLNIGDLIEVEEKTIGNKLAKVIDKRVLVNIEAINDWMAFLDTGYPANETRAIIKRMYSKIQNWDQQPIYYYLIKYHKEKKK